MKKLTRLNHGGETIVEVLISIAVISAALGGAFAISNRSEKSVQANQERYQAQLFANKQADLIKGYAIANPGGVPISGSGDAFCINNTGTITLIRFSDTTFSSSCLEQSLFNVRVIPSITNQKAYIIQVEWDSLTSKAADGKDRLELIYGI